MNILVVELLQTLINITLKVADLARQRIQLIVRHLSDLVLLIIVLLRQEHEYFFKYRFKGFSEFINEILLEVE